MRSVKAIIGAACALVATSSLASALVRIDVDLASQTMHVATGDGGRYDWPISSGRAGHLTPQGRFRPVRLYPIVYSARYHNAPMPHSIFFYGQYAIHGTQAVGSLGRPASHGCIRLAPAHAAMLYARVRSEGAAISIRGDAPARAPASAAAPNHRRAPALAYAPIPRARTLRDWIFGPLANH
jgi:L,D-transpeptidase catalytic domain